MKLTTHLLLCTSAWLAPTIASATELVSPRSPDAIYGGELASTCQWPSAIGVYGAQTDCTASLVHPEIIVTAAHCAQAGPLNTVTLGENTYAPEYELELAECKQHPNYRLDYPDYADFMYCRLAQPVIGVPTVPILMGCEVDELVPGASAVLAGYGLTNDGGPIGPKRFVTTQVDYLEDSRVFFVGGTAHGTCDGDSGGPSYLQLSDGTWRVFGTTTGGMVCGDAGQSELIHLFVPWIEMETGIDITPCHDADGTWAPTAECGGFPAEPDSSHGSWAELCGGAPITDPSETCGPAFGDDQPEADSGGESGMSEGGDEADDGPDDPDPEGSDDDDHDDGDTDDDTGTTPESTGDRPPETPGEDADRGCGCTTDGSPHGAMAVAFTCLLVGFRRRR